MAGQLKAAGKLVLFHGFKEMLIPYLDIEPLMPPGETPMVAHPQAACDGAER